MNREQVSLHLQEAREAIESTLSEAQVTPDYSDAEFSVEMQHIYHRLNTAWNSRAESAKTVSEGTDADFNRWSEFPVDLPVMRV